MALEGTVMGVVQQMTRIKSGDTQQMTRIKSHQGLSIDQQKNDLGGLAVGRPGCTETVTVTMIKEHQSASQFRIE